MSDRYEPSPVVAKIFDDRWPDGRTISRHQQQNVFYQIQTELIRHYMPAMDAETKARAERTLRHIGH